MVCSCYKGNDCNLVYNSDNFPIYPPEGMKLLTVLLLCAAVLGGTAGLPSNDEYPEDALMEELQSMREEGEFALSEETGDDVTGVAEVGELFEGDIQGADMPLPLDSKPDSVEYTDEEESSDNDMFREDGAGLSEDSEDAAEDSEQSSSNDGKWKNDIPFKDDMGGLPDDKDSPADDFDEAPDDEDSPVDEVDDDKVTSTEEVYLIEGDILASREEILQAYDPDDVKNMMGITVNRNDAALQAATSSSKKLWPGRTVPYKFHSSLSASRRALISSAINAWQRATCLRFVLRTTQRSYLNFRGDKARCSSRIGRQGGAQSLFIGPRCSRGNAIHEIGHAVGFWHEQSRPDRDRYVKILKRNIKRGKGHNFMRRSHHDVDYQGTEYDYGSIMHYGRAFFSKCTNNPRVNCPTIAVSNSSAYSAQGRPTLGQRSGLSATDILQARRLYKCPGPGIRGRLRVYIRYARNLPDTDPIFNKPDPYVRISAVSSSGGQWIKRTSSKSGTTNPTFNQVVEFGGNTWQFFRIRVWDSDGGLTGKDDPMTQSQTIPIRSGSNANLIHCASTSCRGFLRFSYTLIPDRRECSPNPCRNGGTCIERIAAFTCRCRSGYGGKRCEFRRRSLQVFARLGRNLPDKDGFLKGKSDPYVRFTARDSDGNNVVRSTRRIKGNHNPVWNQRITFPVDTWRSLQVQVFDSDLGRDDALSRAQTFSITPGPHRYIRHCALTSRCSGYILFDYTF